MRHEVTAPAARQDQPTDSSLGDVLSLAQAEEQRWPELEIEARSQGLVCMAEEEEAEPDAEVSPDPEAGNPDDPDNSGGGELASFLDDYDLGEVPDEARPAFEAHVKRVSGAYTKQRQQDTQIVREAQQAREVVEGLRDPDLAPLILERLGVQVPPEDGLELDDDFAEMDPNDRLDAFEAQVAQEREQAQTLEQMQRENAFVTRQIESLEDELKAEFTDEEVELLCMYADGYRDKQGNPDVKAAHRVLESVATQAQQRLIERKRTAPRRMGSGRAGSRKVDLTKETPEERRERMALAVDALQAP